MKIRQMRLQNVKSYSDETVAFNDGVNFISGVNGAGKTTIIESIGYTLFNSKPANNVTEFVRYGQKTGIVTIEFEANDGRLYRIVRKFGSVNSWLVFDMETDSEVNLHGAADVVPWLKEAMGIEPDQDLAQVFDDVVGVSQGTFTAPFLETPLHRKMKFDRVFKVESYRDAFQKSKDVLHRIDDATRELEIQKAEKAGNIKDYEDVKLKSDEVVLLISGLEREVAARKEEKASSEKLRDGLRGREREIRSVSGDLQVKAERVRNLEESLAKLESELANARISAGILEKNREGYEAYLGFKKEQEILEKQRGQRDSLKDRLAANERAYGADSAKLDTEKTAVRNERDELDETGRKIVAASESAGILVEKSEERLRNVTEIKNGLVLLKDASDTYEKCRSDVIKQNIRLHSGLEKFKTLESSRMETAARLAKEAETLVRIGRLSALEEEKAALARELAGEQQKLATLRDNLDKSGDGKCPFLDAPCLNIGGDLKAYFSGRINEEQKILAGLLDREKHLDGEISSLSDARKELLQLENDRTALENMRREESKFSLEFRRSFDNLTGTGLRQAAAAAAGKAAESGAGIGSFAGDRTGYEALKVSFNEEFKSFADSWDIYAVSAAMAGEPDAEKAEDILDYSSSMADRAERLSAALEKLYNGYAGIAGEEYNARLSESVKHKGDLANAKKQQDDLKARSIRLDGRLLKLKETEDRLIQLAAEKTDIVKGLSVFDGLDGSIAENRDRLLAGQEAYDTYMKHQVDASRVGPLSSSIKNEKENILKEKDESNRLTVRLTELNRDFTEEALKQAEAASEKLSGELIQAESSLLERRSELTELKRRLSSMDKLKKEIADIETRLSGYGRIREMTGFIRGILNRAGEKVSAVYREYLANEANKLYREVSRENVTLEWRDDYEVFLVDSLDGRQRERCFRQLSGGEQMTAALAMRLCLLKQLSGAGVGFFDEPTTNLDEERRGNLAQVLPQVTGNFDQLFVISHDDSFDSMTENIVQLRKDSGDGTKLA